MLICIVSLWLYLQDDRYIRNDNAYIKTDIVTLSSEISGKVLEVSVTDNQKVKQGNILVKIYDERQCIILASKEVNLAAVYSELISLQAEYTSKELGMLRAETDLKFHDRELNRLRQLFENDSISKVQFDQAEFSMNISASAEFIVDRSI